MSISVERMTGIFEPQNLQIRVGHRYGKVVLFLGDSAVEINTPEAVKIGLAMVKLAALVEDGEFINLQINGKDINLLPEISTNLGGAILRKADTADDWQRAIALH